MLDDGPTYDVYLLLNPFRGNVREFCILTRVLADLDGIYLQAAEGFYAPVIDSALVVLCFSGRARRRLGAKLIHLFAGRTGLPMVAPEALSAEDSQRFLVDHMSRYDTYVQQYAAVDEPVGLVERTILHLAEHVAPLPRAGTERDYNFDLGDEVPLLNPRKPTHPHWLRDESVA